ncbi:MAG TPA: hypothetical protein VFI34_13145 [Candidatus Limnocylindrales bacterium]|nr:hypothetical protein [Candidatus Limnocylindrales bacterium]
MTETEASGVGPEDERPGPAASGDAPEPTSDRGAPRDGPEPLPESASLRGPVGAREILWKALDLNLAAARDVRRAAILIGLLSLFAVGPLVVAIVAFGTRLDRLAPGGFASELSAISAIQGSRNIVIVVALIALGCLVALSIDSQLLAVDVIARRATGRTFALRPSLEIVRMRFWRLLRANVLIGLILIVPRWVFEQVVAPNGVVRESQFVVLTIIGVVLSIPFAYVATWILLGQVGARESVRRSWRLARARPSLAVVIAVINQLFQAIAIFALGAAAELLLRVVDALGLGNATGLGLLPLAVVIGLGIVAAGSLLVTIAALTAAPPVVAFLRLTGDASGLDVLRDPDNPFAAPRVEPLVTRPMIAALGVELLFGLIAIAQLL